MGKHGIFVLLFLASTAANAALREQTVQYSSGGTPLQGLCFLALFGLALLFQRFVPAT